MVQTKVSEEIQRSIDFPKELSILIADYYWIWYPPNRYFYNRIHTQNLTNKLEQFKWSRDKRLTIYY